MPNDNRMFASYRLRSYVYYPKFLPTSNGWAKSELNTVDL